MHPQQLLLQGPDEPLGDAVALGGVGEARAGLDPEEVQLLLEPVADVLRPVVMPEGQALQLWDTHADSMLIAPGQPSC